MKPVINQRRREKASNLTLEVPVMLSGVTSNGREYDAEELVDILITIPFNKISVNVNSYKTYTYPDSNKKGIVAVGYINSFTDISDEYLEGDMKVTIFAPFVEIVKAMKDPIIFPRVILDREGNIISITGLDICPAEHYDYLFSDDEVIETPAE